LPFGRAARRLLLIAALAAAATAGAHAEAPRRVVSFNVCADQLVLALADPEQIAGLSPYAANPALSVVAEKARGFRRLDWQAESAIPVDPDLVLIGTWDRAMTRRMLTRLGFRVVTVEVVSDIDAARTQIRDIAALLGHPERGERLLAELEAARMRLAAVRPPSPMTALVVERGGYTAGPASFSAGLMAEAGLRLPAGAPKTHGGFVSLERLLLMRPDLVFLKDPPAEPQDQGSVMFSHPALLAAYPPERRIALPTRFTICAGPALIAAFDYLAAVMARLPARP
jgi:iron complex transport system substrate-binding protein